MINLKDDFPIFKNNQWVVYLDNGATTQKPQIVIEWVSKYVSNDYANIHRWFYELSEKSEHIYETSKDIVAQAIWWKPNEIIYTYNSTYWVNILAYTLIRSNILKKWDKILLSVLEHHANVVPWQILSEMFWVKIEFIWVDENFDLDLEDFKKKFDSSVKLVAITYVSNVTWSITNFDEINKIIDQKALLFVDASQAVPNFKIDVNKIKCDFLVFTWHKVMAYTWIWVLWIKREILKTLKPWVWWWWAIKDVSTSWYEYISWFEWFEIWTPNLIWALSLQKSFEYIEKIWWYETITKIEKDLTNYMMDKFLRYEDKLQLIWSKNLENRVGVFSFIPRNSKVSVLKIWELLSMKNICIRSWWHCAYPFMKFEKLLWTARASLYIYNDNQDIDKFFDELLKII